MKLGDHKGRKVTEPDFGKKFMIWRYLQKCLQLSVGWLLGSTILSETDLRILLILCMKLGDYKGRKITARFLKKILDFEIFGKRSQN